MVVSNKYYNAIKTFIKMKLKKQKLRFFCAMLFIGFAQLNAQTDNVFLGGATDFDDGTGTGTSTFTTGGSNTTGDYNVFLGDGAGALNIDGGYSTFVGTLAGANNTASENVFIGYQAGFLNTTDSDNVFIGFRAGYYNDDSDGTFVGTGAGFNNTTGGDNTFIGESAGFSVTTGDDNTFIGQKAGGGTFIGATVSTSATTFPNTASDNTVVGSAAGFKLKTGYRNAFFGSEAGYDNETGYRNTFVGDSTGIDNNAGRLNTFVGQAAGAANENADYNTFIGIGAGGDNNRTNNTSNANRNTYLGTFAGYSNREGEDNVGIGAFADYATGYDILGAGGIFTTRSNSNTNVSRSTFMGAQSFPDNDDVIAIGYKSRVDGARSIAIGANSRARQTNSMALGYAVDVDQANTLALGGNLITNRYSVGIGTVAANRNASLHLADVDKGFLINRVTTVERTTMITAPASGVALTTTDEGLMVYDTDLDALYVWDGTAWTTSGNTDAQAISNTTNVLSITGSTDTVDLSGYLDNTDSQNLASATLSNTILTVAIEGGTSVDVDLSPILSVLETQNTNQQAQIDDLITRITDLEACACNTLTVNEVGTGDEAEARKYGPILYQNIPNPFNGTTSIKYYVPINNKRAAIVFSNSIGQVIDNVPLKKLGDGELFFNSDSLAKGVYFYTLYVDARKIDSKKMVIE